MNILIINWRDIKHPKAGGAEVYFHELSKRWIKKGHNVIWLSGGWKNCKKQEEVDGIRIIRVGGELSLYMLVPLEYIKIRKQVDVIIDIENGLPFFFPLFSMKPKILHIHHSHKEVWNQEAEGKGIKEKVIAVIGKILETKIMPVVYKNIGVTTISKSSAEEIKKESNSRILGIINPGFTINKVPKIRRTKFPSILFVNRVKKYKGADTLVKAFLKVEKKVKNAKLYIAGSGDYLQNIKKLANNNKKIKILGFISEDDKYKLMESSWIFVNPSFKEGWGIVNIEANYFGMPVIGSNVSGIKDSVVDGKTGLLFKYGDENDLAEKMLTLIKNKKLRNNMGREAIKWAKSFSWEKAAYQFLKIIEGEKNAIR